MTTEFEDLPRRAQKTFFAKLRAGLIKGARDNRSSSERGEARHSATHKGTLSPRTQRLVDYIHAIEEAGIARGFSAIELATELVDLDPMDWDSPPDRQEPYSDRFEYVPTGFPYGYYRDTVPPDSFLEAIGRGLKRAYESPAVQRLIQEMAEAAELGLEGLQQKRKVEEFFRQQKKAILGWSPPRTEYFNTPGFKEPPTIFQTERRTNSHNDIFELLDAPLKGMRAGIRDSLDGYNFSDGFHKGLKGQGPDSWTPVLIGLDPVEDRLIGDPAALEAYRMIRDIGLDIVFDPLKFGTVAKTPRYLRNGFRALTSLASIRARKLLIALGGLVAADWALPDDSEAVVNLSRPFHGAIGFKGVNHKSKKALRAAIDFFDWVEREALSPSPASTETAVSIIGKKAAPRFMPYGFLVDVLHPRFVKEMYPYSVRSARVNSHMEEVLEHIEGRKPITKRTLAPTRILTKEVYDPRETDLRRFLADQAGLYLKNRRQAGFWANEAIIDLPGKLDNLPPGTRRSAIRGVLVDTEGKSPKPLIDWARERNKLVVHLPYVMRNDVMAHVLRHDPFAGTWFYDGTRKLWSLEEAGFWDDLLGDPNRLWEP